MHKRCKKLGKSVREFIEDLDKIEYSATREEISQYDFKTVL